MNFLENIFSRLHAAADRVILAEAHVGGMPQAASGRRADGDRLGTCSLKSRPRARFCALRASRKGDRCALVAPNSIRWAALDLAILSEGLIAVPLYARQAAAELAAMLRDAGPGLICCGDAALRDAIAAAWPDAPRLGLFDEIFASATPRLHNSRRLHPPRSRRRIRSPFFTRREPRVKPKASCSPWAISITCFPAPRRASIN